MDTGLTALEARADAVGRIVCEVSVDLRYRFTLDGQAGTRLVIEP